MFEGMIAGRPYHYADAYIQRVARLSQAKLAAIHAEDDEGKREVLLRSYFKCAPDAKIGLLPPLFCEYGVSRLSSLP